MSKAAEQLIKDYTINGCTPLNAGDIATAETNEQKRKDNLFKPGNQAAKGNHQPRTRLNKRFIKDLEQLWYEKGNQALQIMLDRKPEAFCLMVASLLPKHVEIQGDGITWVINASPRLSIEDWQAQHNLLEQTEVTD